MAGSDTFRGCSFQAAYSVLLALDVLEGEGIALVLEGDEDIVDAAIESEDANDGLCVQAKTKAEPYVWSPGEIIDVLQDWLGGTSSQSARFEFVTDGPLGPSVTNELAPVLRRLAESSATVNDHRYLLDKGLDPSDRALARVSIRSRLPSGRDLLERAAVRVLELHERVEPIAVEQARDIVNRLFAATVLGAGEQDAQHRRLERREISELVGVPTTVIDDAEPWSTEIEATYLNHLQGWETNPAWTLLELLEVDRPAVLSFVEPRDLAGDDKGPVRADALLESEDHGVLILGPAGAGKTTTLAQIQAAAAEGGLVPISLRLSSYSGERLRPLLRRSLERVLSRRVSPGALVELLGRAETLVLIDGAGELVPEQRDALIEDVKVLGDQYRGGARLVLVAREAAAFSQAGLATYTLLGLDDERRRLIAAGLVENSEEMVSGIEQDLGDVVANPLLFTMALGLRSGGIAAKSRVDLFDGFMQGLQQRREGRQLSAAALACLQHACFEIRAQGRYVAEEWWWLDSLARARAALVDAGVLAVDTTAAEELMNEVRGLGLLTPVGELAELGLLHDLFCDWLTSESIRRGFSGLPSPVPESFEEATSFLAEHGELDRDQLIAIAGNAVAAGRAASSHVHAGLLDLGLANELWQQMASQLGNSLREELGSLQVGVSGDSQPWAFLAEDPNEDPTNARLRTLAIGEVSEISVVLDLWIAAIRLALTQQHWSRPVKMPSTEIEVAALVKGTAERHQWAMAELVEALVPGLLHRIESEVGPINLQGWLLPGRDMPGVPGTGQVIRHFPLLYRLTSGSSEIQIIENEESAPSGLPTGEMAAESYVIQRPETAARKNVQEALTRLIPRFDA